MLAFTATRIMEGYVRHASHVDANRRQGAACAYTLVNHWWNVPLYVNARGLTTSAIPWGKGVFKMQFDFLDHTLKLETNDGLVKTLPLGPRSVAEFYGEFLALLQSAGIQVKIWRMPVEIPNPIPFDEDRVHASYDPKRRVSSGKFWCRSIGIQRVPVAVHRKEQPGTFLSGAVLTWP